MLSSEDKRIAREWAMILGKDPCAYCGRISKHIDHIIPVSRNGSGTWDNLTAACANCNISKNAKPLLMFLFSRTLDAEGASVLPYVSSS